jgi:hypothetical protein
VAFWRLCGKSGGVDIQYGSSLRRRETEQEVLDLKETGTDV